MRSGSFETTSEGAYLTVAYLDDFAGDGGPTDNVYNQPGLLSIELQCKVISKALAKENKPLPADD